MLEALGCLGEIGPGDLTTLILHKEEPPFDFKYRPLDLLAGYSVSMLSIFINDSDINVVRTASDTLYAILKYSEPQKMAGMFNK